MLELAIKLYLIFERYFKIVSIELIDNFEIFNNINTDYRKLYPVSSLYIITLVFN